MKRIFRNETTAFTDTANFHLVLFGLSLISQVFKDLFQEAA